MCDQTCCTNVTICGKQVRGWVVPAVTAATVISLVGIGLIAGLTGHSPSHASGGKSTQAVTARSVLGSSPTCVISLPGDPWGQLPDLHHSSTIGLRSDPWGELGDLRHRRTVGLLFDR